MTDCILGSTPGYTIVLNKKLISNIEHPERFADGHSRRSNTA